MDSGKKLVRVAPLPKLRYASCRNGCVHAPHKVCTPHRNRKCDSCARRIPGRHGRTSRIPPISSSRWQRTPTHGGSSFHARKASVTSMPFSYSNPTPSERRPLLRCALAFMKTHMQASISIIVFFIVIPPPIKRC